MFAYSFIGLLGILITGVENSESAVPADASEHAVAHARAMKALPACNGANDCPFNVPDDFVRTPHGWFHPSCIVYVGEDEVYDSSTREVIQKDGFRRKRTSCSFAPRNQTGEVFDPRDAIASRQTHARPQPDDSKVSGPTVNGFLASVANNAAYYPRVGYLSAYWTVPNSPFWGPLTSASFYMFPGLQTATGTIKQPVLGFNGNDGFGNRSSGWTLTAWDCCVGSGTTGNIDIILFGAPLPVSVGDSIFGSIQGSNCAPSGLCSDWTVSAFDLMSGHGVSGSETGNTQIFGSTYNTVIAGAIEVENVDVCAELSASLGGDFTSVVVRDVNGANIPASSLQFVKTVNATSPNCQVTATPSITSTYAAKASFTWWPNNKPKPNAPTACGVLQANQGLIKGQSLYSCDGRFRLTVQGSDGNVVLYQGGTALWATNKYGTNISFPSEFIIMGADGNFRQYGPDAAWWESGTPGNANARLAVQNDGNMVIYRTNGTVAWASNTCCH